VAGITALGTTYNLPNYSGMLHQLTPADTPFFSAIGGLSGGGQTTDTKFEWETFDLRSAAQPDVLEGADAPTEQGRVRAQVTNVTQIHQDTIGISYSKQAAVGQKAGLANDAVNPVRDELGWQTEQMLKQMVRDVEYSFLRGAYQLPTDNTTSRRTRGLLAAITTNAIDTSVAVPNGTGASAAAATDLITANAHGLANGDQVVFSSVGTATPLATATVYYVVSSSTNTFSVSTTYGGTAVNITADGTVTVAKRSALSLTILNRLMQSVYDSGGIMESGTATLIVGSSQKRQITAAYTAAGYVTKELQANLGGVTVDRIQTDFGVLNLMLNRHMPSDQLVVASLEQCKPVYLETPGKGHFFSEPLAKTGSRDRVQIYGEVGLAYGNQAAHGKLTNLALAV
jgi:hypothetical protein